MLRVDSYLFIRSEVVVQQIHGLQKHGLGNRQLLFNCVVV